MFERDGDSSATLPAPPAARRVPKVTTLHGETRVDEYAWLRERGDPAVRAYLEAENAYAEAVMAPTRPFQEDLYKEMLARIKETDLSVPFRKGDWLYYGRTEQGLQYPILCRKRPAEGASEEVVLDLNLMAEGHGFYSVDVYTVSDDGNVLAFSDDTTGYREYTLRTKDLRTGALGPEATERVSSAAWAADDRTLFYVVDDDAKRPYRLYRHVLGEGPDDLVYEEKDERFTIDVFRSRSRGFLLLTVSSHTASEVRFLDPRHPRDPWRVVEPRRPDHEYDVDHGGDVFFIRTNDAGRNFRLVSAPVSDPGRSNWTEVLPHRAEIMLAGIDAFEHHVVLHEREGGLERLRILDRASGDAHDVSFPEPAYALFGDVNAEYETRLFRFRYQSFVTPPSVFDYDMKARTRTLLKQNEVLGGYDPSRYAVERLTALAPDGVRIPISMAYRKDVPRDGTAPLYLNAYGAYGIAMPVLFSSNRLSLLDRGVVCALAHVRGGGDLGKTWHDGGRMLRKRNTFTDFVAVAEHLVREKFTSPERLVIEGGSAGGLLMGAVVNLRPDLFKAVVSKVPFVDVLNTMLDTSLPLTVGEFEEWGDPRDPEHYAYMRSYCPYTNLAPGAYPAMLVKTSFHDSQVMYWEPAKYVARLRRLKTDSNPLLLRTNLKAGHGGASGRYDALREAAYDVAFILTQVGIRT